MIKSPTAFFDDMPDDFGGGAQAPAAPLPGVRVDYVTGQVSQAPVKSFMIRCAACGGSGRFRGYSGRDQGECFRCKGKGEVDAKAQASRAKAKATRAANEERRAQDLADSKEAFKAAHPEVMTWLVRSANREFEFAVSLLEGFEKFGRLTDGQLAAVERILAKDAERDQERKAAAPVCDASKLVQAFDKAKAKAGRPNAMGVWLKPLHLQARDMPLVFRLGSEGTQWAGKIFVKTEAGDKLGVIAGGKFEPRRECTAAERDAVVEACQDPAKAATAYGKAWSRCGVCGMTLTNDGSIERGIGPVCAEKYGF